MQSLTTLPSDMLDNIFDLLFHEEKLVVRQVCRRFSDLIQLPFTLKIFQLRDNLHISARFPDPSMADQFLSHHAHSIRDSKKIDPKTGVITCNRTFAFPPTCEYAFFASANIRYLEMHEISPYLSTDQNLKRLSNFLAGCTIDKMSFFFESGTLSNLSKVPSIVSRLRANHVMFIVDRIPVPATALTSFTGKLASDLVSVGVQHIVFSGRAPPGIFSNTSGYDLLLRFFNANIKTITVNYGVLFYADVYSDKVHDLVDRLAMLGKRLKLIMNVRLKDSSSSLEMDEEKYGMHVKVVCGEGPQTKFGACATLITIECDTMRSLIGNIC